MIYNETNPHHYFYTWLYATLLTHKWRENSSTSVLGPCYMQIRSICNPSGYLSLRFNNPLIRSQKLKNLYLSNKILSKRLQQRLPSYRRLGSSLADGWDRMAFQLNSHIKKCFFYQLNRQSGNITTKWSS